MKDDNGGVSLPVSAAKHIDVGAPKEFYKGHMKFIVHFDVSSLDVFVAKNKERWFEYLTFIERTLRYPDTCSLKKPNGVLDEYLGYEERMVLKRIESGTTCTCNLMKVDGCLYVPLLGRFAPTFK